MQRGGPGGVGGERRGWWERDLAVEVLIPARLRRALPGGGPGASDFLCSPKESHQRKGNPRFAAATSCPCAVSLRCSTTPAVCATRASFTQCQAHQAGNYFGKARVREARPVLDRNPGPVCAARRRTGAPNETVGYLRFALEAFVLSGLAHLAPFYSSGGRKQESVDAVSEQL